jgi:hypothetical protein
MKVFEKAALNAFLLRIDHKGEQKYGQRFSSGR